MDGRTKLKLDEKALLDKLQRGTWALAELQWLERHLRPDAPTVLVAEVRHKLQMLRESLHDFGTDRRIRRASTPKDTSRSRRVACGMKT